MAVTFKTRKDHHDRVQRVMIRIDRQLDRPWDLDALAEVACLFVSYFISKNGAFVTVPSTRWARQLPTSYAITSPNSDCWTVSRLG